MSNDSAPWCPVLYGRTRNVDEWWRVLPAGGANDWLRDAVHSALAGGRGLSGHLRYVLARSARRTLVAMACRAARLSPTMGHDAFERPLYYLVGWVTDSRHVLAPTLPELREQGRSWAAAAYERWLAPDWERVPAPARASSPEPAPWAEPLHPDESTPVLSAQRNSTWLYPAAEANALWESARVSPSPMVVVVGWQHLRDADFPGVTAMAADDVMQRARRNWPAPAEPAASPRAPRGYKQVFAEAMDGLSAAGGNSGGLNALSG